MTITKENAIRRKIEGLLAMAKDKANENEAMAAMALASRLMLKHDIDEADLTPGKAKHKAQFGQMIDERQRFYTVLAQAVGVLFQTRPVRYPRSKQFAFAGRESSIEISELTFAWILMQVEDLYKLSLPKGLSQGERSRYRKTFKEACAYRIYERCLEESKTQQIEGQGTALVIHKEQIDKEISDLFKESNIGVGRRRQVKYTHAGAAAAGNQAANRVKFREEVK